MKKYFMLVLMLCLMLSLSGCKEKDKEFVAGDNELIHLTSTPKGGVETYEIYTTNIMIYVDGTVKIYASDFVRWLGTGDIPEETVTISPEEVEEIKRLIVSEDLYNLRENVGNKDGISGTVKYMTIYSANGTNTTGGISVSNRQFVRAYDRIEAMVREELFIYTSMINKLQYKGYVNYNNRSVGILDRQGELLLDHQYINDVYVGSEQLEEENVYYVAMVFNEYGCDILRDVSSFATEEDIVVLSLHINDTYETSITINAPIQDGIIIIPQNTQEAANQLSEKIKTGLR